MKKSIYTASIKVVLGLLIIGSSSCKIEPMIDPNNSSLEEIQSNATKSEIQNLAIGIESGMRNNLSTYLDDVGVIGREFYRFSGSDPRWTSDLLGKGNAVLDNNTFYLTNTWAARYRVVRNTNILIDALKNTKADDITAQEKNATNGFAKTIQAYQLLLNLNLQYNNGIRADVKDPEKLGPFLSYTASLDAIRNLLDDGASDLNNGGSNFIFPLSSGFSGFDKPADFKKFNRALAARVAAYKENFTDVLTLLNESFVDLTGTDLKKGVYHIYSTAGTDLLNDMFLNENSSPSENARIAHPSFITGTASNDKRLTKVSKRSSTAASDGLAGDYDVMVYKTNVDPIPIIRNEELILLYAEAKARTGVPTDAVNAINTIRTANGLLPYTGGLSEPDLINEILQQRRYSLFAEGHYWIDMRRYNKLVTLPIDRPGDDVWVQFPRPANEQ